LAPECDAALVDAVIAGPKADISGIDNRLVIQTPLEASDVPYRQP
jgi:hypothetical protein